MVERVIRLSGEEIRVVKQNEKLKATMKIHIAKGIKNSQNPCRLGYAWN